MMHDTVAAIHIMLTCGMHRVPIQRIFLLLSVAMTPTFNHTKEYPGSYMYAPIAIMHGLPAAGARVSSPESLSLGISVRDHGALTREIFIQGIFLTAFHIQQLCSWCI